MAGPFSISDTAEFLPFREVRDGCVVADTHLAGVIALSGANLFEKKEGEAVAFLNGFSFALAKMDFPVQLVAASRPKRIDAHCARVRAECAGSDFEVVIDDPSEWFEINHRRAVAEGKLTRPDVAAMAAAEKLPMRRSMLGSYAERVEKAVAENRVTEKRYYLVVSTLDRPSGLSTRDEVPSAVVDWDNPDAFSAGRAKLSERMRTAEGLMSGHAGMGCSALGTEDLEALLFESLHFPLSQKHAFDRSATSYGAPVPFAANGVPSPAAPERRGLAKAFTAAEAAAGWLLNRISASSALPERPGGARTYPFQHLVKPYCVDDSDPGHVRVNGQYCYTLHLTRFAKETLEDLELWPLLTMEWPFDLSVHLVQLEKRAILIDLERSVRQNEADLDERVKGKSEPEAAVIRDEASSRTATYRRLADALKNGTSAPYSVSVDVTFRAGTLSELSEIKTAVSRKLESRGIGASECDSSQWEGFVSTMPVLTNLTAGWSRQFDRMDRLLEEVAHLFPYCPQSVPDGRGTMLGLSVQGEGDDRTRAVELFDLFDRDRLMNSNMAIIGQSGSGKTTFAHGFIKNQALLGNRFLILDFLGNYHKWAHDMPDAFRVVKIDPTSQDKVNPCDLVVPSPEQAKANEWPTEPRALRELLANQKTAELAAYFKVFLGTIFDPVVKGLLDEAAKKVFSARLAGVDPSVAQVVSDVFLSDILKALQDSLPQLRESDPDKASAASRAAGVLAQYATGSMSGMFNAPTSVALDGKGMVFSLRGNPTGPIEEVATLQALMLIKRIAYSSRNNVILIDELHKIFRMDSPEVQEFFRAQIAMIRNLRGGVVGMTQQLRQVMDAQAGKEFLDMCSAKMYLAGGKTEGSDGLDVSRYDTALSRASERWLIENNRPGFAILRVGEEQTQLIIENHPDLSIYRRYEAPLS